MITINIETLNVIEVCKPHTPHFHLRWTIGPVSEQNLPQGPPQEIPMLQLTSTQQASLGVTVTDKKGNPAQVQSPTWSSSDDTVVDLRVDESDPMKATILADTPGTAQVNFQADADMGDGVKPITGTLDVTVVAGEAVNVTITTGTPEEQPE